MEWGCIFTAKRYKESAKGANTSVELLSRRVNHIIVWYVCVKMRKESLYSPFFIMAKMKMHTSFAYSSIKCGSFLVQLYNKKWKHSFLYLNANIAKSHALSTSTASAVAIPYMGCVHISQDVLSKWINVQSQSLAATI